MTLDSTDVSSEMARPSEAGLPSFSASAFFQFLKIELDRANRYNLIVSLLLLQVLPTPESKCETEPEGLAELTALLKETLRSTDLLGSLGNGLVGIIIPHAGLETASRLLERLQAESLFSLFRQRTGCDLRAAFSVYPTDATSINALFDIALDRIR